LSEQRNEPAPAVERSELAKGAGLAALSRLGALIEVVAQPAYTWMFGLANYGLYIVLWASINILSNLFDLSMLQALQRVVTTARTEKEAHAAVKFALLATIIPASLCALVISVMAIPVSMIFSVSVEQAPQLPLAIALFAWTLPLWILLEVATAAARARRAFGPEIRLRIFWEQLARLGFAVLLYLAGVQMFGLLVAHILSLFVTGILSLHLLTKYYDWRMLVKTPVANDIRAAMLKTGFATMPPNLARRAFNDLPPVILNMLIPGSGGAVAAGLYGIARKVASIPLIVRQTFLYVLAPLSSAQAAVDHRDTAHGANHPVVGGYFERIRTCRSCGAARARCSAHRPRGRSHTRPRDAYSGNDRASRPAPAQQRHRSGNLGSARVLADTRYGRDRNGHSRRHRRHSCKLGRRSRIAAERRA